MPPRMQRAYTIVCKPACPIPLTDRTRLRLEHHSRMPELLVTASIIEQSPSHFMVVVSSSAVGAESDVRTDVEIADASTRAEADAAMRRLIGTVVDRAERRGDRVQRVRRVLPLSDPAPGA